MNTLKIEKSLKKGKVFYDFVVDGISFLKTLDAQKFDLIGPLGWGLKSYQNILIKEFLGQKVSELPSKRIPIYVCSECGDFHCGAITAEIIFENNKIIWRKFGYENGIDEIDFQNFSLHQQLIFDAENYVEEFKKVE